MTIKLSLRFGLRFYIKTSHSGFVYCRYFRKKEKVGGKRGLKPASRKCGMYKVVPIILQA